jgi:hypothetical protein
VAGAQLFVSLDNVVRAARNGERKFADRDRGRVSWWFAYEEEVLDGFRGMLAVLHGQVLARRAGSAWRHRRGLVALGRRYLSGL